MRVTNKMLSNNFLRDMNNNLENMQTLQQQMSSGKEIRKPSDNPFKAARAMQLNTDINANKQYNENISDTVNWLDTTDTALGQAGNVLQRVRELLVSSGNAAYGPDEKTAIKDEINEKVGELSQILNTNFDGKYVFGGTRGTTKPTSTVTDSSGNTALIYNKKETKVQVSDSSLWAGTSIGFNLDGTDYTVNVSSPLPGSGSVNDIVDNINSQINNVPELKGKLQASMETNETKTYIKFTSLTDGDIKMQKPASGSISTDLSSVVGTSGITLGNDQVNMIKSSLSVEISQGVSIDYNVNAGNIMNFTSEGGKTYSLSSLLSDITNHLSGKLSTTDPAGSDPANL
ncbi:MAG: flagellar hook-associated protein FlgL, partial [Bacillota bacterium]|nr:flagellar hook-associated protein FlgL [Bacillota bacterium]